MKTLAQHWDAYRAMVVPAGASAYQVQETQAAFYGGASMVILELLTIGDDDSIDEDKATAIMEGLHDECEEFAQTMGVKSGTIRAGAAPIGRA